MDDEVDLTAERSLLLRLSPEFGTDIDMRQVKSRSDEFCLRTLSTPRRTEENIVFGFFHVVL